MTSKEGLADHSLAGASVHFHTQPCLSQPSDALRVGAKADCAILACGAFHRKSRPKAAFNSGVMTVQANRTAAFGLRRKAMKPMPAKPRIIIAQVEGSGTAAVNCSAV